MLEERYPNLCGEQRLDYMKTGAVSASSPAFYYNVWFCLVLIKYLLDGWMGE